ncbi:MAG: hypothetical protein MUC59_17675 [Saprospiraceae bacterium]|jgi:hypothetical protein|nr:hypothetical protein [Saprospiraceae bacterium]
MKNFKFLFAILALNAVLFSACDKEDDHNHNEGELITTVKLTFTEVGGGSTEFTVKDLDGDGGDAPVADDITLKANTAYTIGVEFLDESKADHTHDITEEVKEESAEHLVCFDATGSMTAPTIGDLDGNGKPIGLESALATGAAGAGSLQVTLKHLPNKSATDPCSTGDTDVDVTFEVTIE